MPALAQVADVAAIDMPGFGGSSRPSPRSERLSLDHLAEHALAAANALSWTEPVVLIGHSHGGGVAQVAAARHPDRVAGVVALATLGSPAHKSYRLLSLPGVRVVTHAAGWVLQAKPLRGVTRLIMRAVMKDIFSPEPVAAERVTRELEALAANPSILTSMVDVTLGRPSEQLRTSVANIQCRVLFMHGERDSLVPVQYARTLHDLIRSAGGRSEMLVLPAAGHMLIEFQASEVLKQIVRFLALGD